MAARNPQTHAKRARELALREKRERKREKKEEAAALKRAVANGEIPAELIDGELIDGEPIDGEPTDGEPEELETTTEPTEHDES